MRFHRYAADQSVGRNEPYFPLSTRWIQACVAQTAKNAHKETDDEDWLKVSSHDLRVYISHTMLVKERVNPWVVMEVGRWLDYQSIKPYPGKPSEANIIGEFERIGRD